MARGDINNAARIDTTENEDEPIGEQSEPTSIDANPDRIGENQIQLTNPDGTREKATLVAVDSGKQTIAKLSETGNPLIETATPAEIAKQKKEGITAADLKAIFDSSVQTYAAAAGREIPNISATERNKMIKKALRADNPNEALMDFIKHHPALSEQPEPETEVGPQFIEVTPDAIYSKGADAIQQRLEELQTGLATSSKKSPEEFDKIHEEINRLKSVLPIVREVDRLNLDEQAADAIQETLDQLNKKEQKNLKRKIGTRGKQILGTSGRINALTETLKKEEQELLDLSELFEEDGETTVAKKDQIKKIKEEQVKLQERLKKLEIDSAQFSAQSTALEKAGLPYDVLLPGTDEKLYDELVTQNDSDPGETKTAIEALLKDNKISKKVRETLLLFQKDSTSGELKRKEIPDPTPDKPDFEGFTEKELDTLFVQFGDQMNELFKKEQTPEIKAKIEALRKKKDTVRSAIQKIADHQIADTAPDTNGNPVLEASSNNNSDDDLTFGDTVFHDADATAPDTVLDPTRPNIRTPKQDVAPVSEPSTEIPVDASEKTTVDTSLSGAENNETETSEETIKSIESQLMEIQIQTKKNFNELAKKTAEDWHMDPKLADPDVFHTLTPDEREEARKIGAAAYTRLKQDPRVIELDKKREPLWEKLDALKGISASYDEIPVDTSEKTSVDTANPFSEHADQLLENSENIPDNMNKEFNQAKEELQKLFISDVENLSIEQLEQATFEEGSGWKIIDRIRNTLSKADMDSYNHQNSAEIYQEVDRLRKLVKELAEEKVKFDEKVRLILYKKYQERDAELNKPTTDATPETSTKKERILTAEELQFRDGMDIKGDQIVLLDAWNTYTNDDLAKNSLITFGFPKKMIEGKTLKQIWNTYQKSNDSNVLQAMNLFLEDASSHRENNRREEENKKEKEKGVYKPLPTVESVSRRSVASKSRRENLTETPNVLSSNFTSPESTKPIAQEKTTEVEPDVVENSANQTKPPKRSEQFFQLTPEQQTEENVFQTRLTEHLKNNPDLAETEELGEKYGDSAVALGMDVRSTRNIQDAYNNLSVEERSAKGIPATWDEIIRPPKPSLLKRLFGNPKRDRKIQLQKLKDLIETT